MLSRFKPLEKLVTTTTTTTTTNSIAQRGKAGKVVPLFN